MRRNFVVGNHQKRRNDIMKLAAFLILFGSIFFAPRPIDLIEGCLLAIFWMLWHISDILADILKNKSPEDKKEP